ncbi:hypothetical protein E4U54_008406 [Claviceps lovelessii]|nr:hypothetical protein E4U54_008406 [Claviceps lovelessii]
MHLVLYERLKVMMRYGLRGTSWASGELETWISTSGAAGCEDQVASSTVGGRKAPVQRLLYIVFNKSGNQKASAACAEASPLTLPVPFPQLSSLSACTNLF